MSDRRASVEVKTTGPGYLGWRGELLSELALARVPGLLVHKRPDRAPPEVPYQFLVATAHGFCFFVEVRAFSSLHLEVPDVATVREWRWSLEADLVRRARTSHSAVLLFLFDADTDHGRYLRLDTLPAPGSDVHRLVVRFPVEQTLTKDSLAKLIEELQGTPKS
jgi:hypothetical protein